MMKSNIKTSYQNKYVELNWLYWCRMEKEMDIFLGELKVFNLLLFIDWELVAVGHGPFTGQALWNGDSSFMEGRELYYVFTCSSSN